MRMEEKSAVKSRLGSKLAAEKKCLCCLTVSILRRCVKWVKTASCRHSGRGLVMKHGERSNDTRKQYIDDGTIH